MRGEAVVLTEEGRGLVAPVDTGVEVPLQGIVSGGRVGYPLAGPLLDVETLLVGEGGIPEDEGVGAVGEDVSLGELFGGEFLDEEGEDEADDGGQYLAAVGAGLLGLQLCIFEEEGFELGVLFLDFGLGLGIGGLFSLHVDFLMIF